MALLSDNFSVSSTFNLTEYKNDNSLKVVQSEDNSKKVIEIVIHLYRKFRSTFTDSVISGPCPFPRKIFCKIVRGYLISGIKRSKAMLRL